MLVYKTKERLKEKQERRPPDNTPAARIFDLRREDERPADFARRIGISQQTLNEMAKGKGWPSTQVLAQVVRRTGADPAYLLFGSERVRTASGAERVLAQIAALISKHTGKMDEREEAILSAESGALVEHAEKETRSGRREPGGATGGVKRA